MQKLGEGIIKSSPKHSNPNYKSRYPGMDSYHIPVNKPHGSPCMSPFWRAQPIRKGKTREEFDFELKIDEEEV